MGETEEEEQMEIELKANRRGKHISSFPWQSKYLLYFDITQWMWMDMYGSGHKISEKLSIAKHHGLDGFVAESRWRNRTHLWMGETPRKITRPSEIVRIWRKRRIPTPWSDMNVWMVDPNTTSPYYSGRDGVSGRPGVQWSLNRATLKKLVCVRWVLDLTSLTLGSVSGARGFLTVKNRD
jgi:hypothetical protein